MPSVLLVAVLRPEKYLNVPRDFTIKKINSHAISQSSKVNYASCVLALASCPLFQYNCIPAVRFKSGSPAILRHAGFSLLSGLVWQPPPPPYFFQVHSIILKVPTKPPFNNMPILIQINRNRSSSNFQISPSSNHIIFKLIKCLPLHHGIQQTHPR